MAIAFPGESAEYRPVLDIPSHASTGIPHARQEGRRQPSYPRVPGTSSSRDTIALGWLQAPPAVTGTECPVRDTAQPVV
jgi:hypothetical protein